jgi:hypothetical protein
MTESNFRAELSIFDLSDPVPVPGNRSACPRPTTACVAGDDANKKKREKGHDAHFRAAEHGCP